MASRGRSIRARNKTTTIGTTALITLGGLGCGRTTPPAPTVSSTSSTAIVDVSASSQPAAKESAIPKEDAQVVAKNFAPYAVTLPNIARFRLYTWTTTDQIEALAKDPTLLTRAESPEHGTSYFEQVLEERAQKKDPLAKLLRKAPFAKQRYAWTAPFATRIGIGAESYGDELIQINLKLDAWFVVMKTSTPELTVVNARNEPVSITNALAHPERLAAAYFVQDKPVTGYRASMAGPNERIGYREYVLFNESMIASYSVGTPEITAELEAETQALEGLLQHIKTNDLRPDYWHRWMVNVTTKGWTEPPDLASPLSAYEAALAFTDYAYQPGERPLFELIENLRKLKLRDKPFTHIPTATFPAASVATPAPAPKVISKPIRGTY